MTLRNGREDLPIFASAYISTAAATALTPQNTWVALGGTWTSKKVSGGISFAAGVWTVPVTGWYQIDIIGGAGNASGDHVIDVGISINNGNPAVSDHVDIDVVDTRLWSMGGPVMVYLTAGQNFRIKLRCPTATVTTTMQENTQLCVEFKGA